jgi:hypothetical protein
MAQTPPRPERSSVVPPYWQQHVRHGSYYSTDGRPTPIGLEDHTDEASESCRVLWAKGVTIDDHVVVSGTAPGLGAYVVWNCTVETLDVSLEPHVDVHEGGLCSQWFAGVAVQCGADMLHVPYLDDRLTIAGRAHEDTEEVGHATQIA